MQCLCVTKEKRREKLCRKCEMHHWWPWNCAHFRFYFVCVSLQWQFRIRLTYLKCFTILRQDRLIFFFMRASFHFQIGSIVHFLIFLSTEAYLFLAGLESAHHLNVCLWCILAFYHLRFGGSECKWFTQASKITPNCRDVKYAFRSHIFLLHSNLIILLLFQAVRQWKRVTHKFEKKVCLGRSK